MRAMNTILSDIVIASGGVVEKPNNRNSLLQDWLDAVIQPIIQRYFIKLDPVLNSYYQLNTPFVATGDFDVTYLLVSSDASADMALEDSSLFSVKVGYCLLYIDNPEGLELLVGKGGDFNRYIFGGQSLLLNGALNSVVLSRRSGTLSATLNGATLGGTFTDTSTLVFKGNVGGGKGRAFNGILANPTFTDLSNPANNQSYKLDQATGNVEYAAENVFGAELWTIGDLNDINYTGSSYGIVVSVPSVPLAGKTVHIKATNNTNQKIRLILNSDLNITLQVGGVLDGYYQMTDDTIIRCAFEGAGSLPIIGDIVDVSIREVSAALTYNNIPESNRELYRFDNVDTWNNISPPPQELPATIEVA